MRIHGLFAAVLALPAVACGGDDGFTTPSTSGVFPDSAFIGRKLRVEISGDATTWDAQTTVSFGDGITVDKVTVGSPTALFADITVTPTAAEGFKDVVVTDGKDTFTLAQGFELKSPIKATFEGAMAQGSFNTFKIDLQDIQNRFDTTSTGDGFFTPLVFTNTQITGGAGMTFNVNNVTDFTVSGTVFIDVDAAPGALTVMSGPDGMQLASPLAGTVDVKPRTATVLADGTAANGSLAVASDSALFEFTPGNTQLVTLTMGASDPNATPGFFVLPASGHFDDAMAFGDGTFNYPFETGAKLYLVALDQFGFTGYSFSLKPTHQTLTGVAEAANNDTGATAQAVVAGQLVTGATLSDQDDVDVYAYTVKLGDAGKKLHIVTGGTDARTDTVISVFNNAGLTTTPCAPNDEDCTSPDQTFHEDLTVTIPAIAQAPVGSKLFIVVSASPPPFFQQAHNAYIASITVE